MCFEQLFGLLRDIRRGERFLCWLRDRLQIFHFATEIKANESTFQIKNTNLFSAASSNNSNISNNIIANNLYGLNARDVDRIHELCMIQTFAARKLAINYTQNNCANGQRINQI